jgi:hypothetical protein
MEPMKVTVLVCNFAYAGNGGYSAVTPHYLPWFARVRQEMAADPRIAKVIHKTAGDTPLPMERNRVVKEAMAAGVDIILMLDSDNVPDLYVGTDPQAKPFWKSSFDFAYERLLRGVPTVVCAPYCGPPPHPVNGGQENVYVFYAAALESQEPGSPHAPMKFEAYSREEAAIMAGISPIAAGPTGVILYTTSAFELMPKKMPVKQVLEDYRTGKVDLERAKQLIEMESWFYYEYEDAECTAKASTEDVTNTREIQMAGILKHGEPVVFCNWDSWAGHLKNKCVGKPHPIRIEQVSQVFAEACRNNISARDQLIHMAGNKAHLIKNEPKVEEEVITESIPELGFKTWIHGKVVCWEWVSHIETFDIKGPLMVVNDLCGEFVVSWAFSPIGNHRQTYFDVNGFRGDLASFGELYLKSICPVDADPGQLDKILETLVIVLYGNCKQSKIDQLIEHSDWVGAVKDGGRVFILNVSEVEAAEFAKDIFGVDEIDVRGNSLMSFTVGRPVLEEEIPQEETDEVQ